jgi:hypothetical protein
MELAQLVLNLMQDLQAAEEVELDRHLALKQEQVDLEELVLEMVERELFLQETRHQLAQVEVMEHCLEAQEEAVAADQSEIKRQLVEEMVEMVGQDMQDRL